MEEIHYFILGCLTLMLSLEGVCQHCNTGWLLYEDECFKYFQENVVFSFTKDQCASKGARLISGLTPKLKDFLLSHSDQYENSSFWFSKLTDNFEDFQRSIPAPNERLSSSTKSSTYSSLIEGKCTYFQHKEFHVGPCDEPKGFICEKDAIFPHVTCPKNAVAVAASCFWNISVSLDLSQAEGVCASRNGWLASLDTRIKETYAAAIVRLKGKSFWIGAKQQNGTLTWNSGKDFEDENFHVVSEGDEGNCVQLGLRHASDNEVALITGACNSSAFSICEVPALATATMPPVTTTVPSTTVLETKCARVESHFRETDNWCFWTPPFSTLDWDSARAYCRSFGGDLASYKDAEEEELELVNVNAGQKGHWIGLRREPGSNDFRWSDDSDLTFTNWAPGEPKTRRSTNFCVAHVGANSTWELLYCGLRRNYVCKAAKVMPKDVTVQKTEEPLTSCLKSENNFALNWYLYRGHCYSIHASHRYSWNMAKMFCRDNGAFLASIHSHEELNFLLRLFSYHSVENSCFWIGLRAKGLRSSYQWDDDSPVDFAHWDDEDDYDAKINIDTCISFDSFTGLWKKNHCDRLNHVICKSMNEVFYVFSTPSPTPPLKGFCPDDWYAFGSKCYKVFGAQSSERETWTNANRKCSEMGSTMISIHSRDEQDFLSLLLLDVGHSMWIGMYSAVAGHMFHWTDGSSMEFTNWDANEPNFRYGKEECVHMVMGTYNLGKWNDNLCSWPSAYICQAPKDPMLLKPGIEATSCGRPDNWFKVGTSCFKIYNEDDDRLTWLQAQTYCLSIESNLAYVGNRAAMSWIRHHLKGLQGYFWIGMREKENKNYAWIGNPFVVYTNWLFDQPQEVSPRENCVAINTEGQWIVMNCYESHPFICSTDPERPTLAPDEENRICPNTSRKWNDFGGQFCYIVEMKNKVQWQDARQNCFHEGGFLASFHDADEMRLIQYHIKDADMPLYIGLGQKPDGSFGWTDGSAVDYVNWASGEPNSHEEMCVEMHTDVGTWNDIKCKESRGYICSTRKIHSVKSSTVDPQKRTSNKKDVQSEVNAGGIMGIVICVLVVLAVAAVSCYYLCPHTKLKSWFPAMPFLK